MFDTTDVLAALAADPNPHQLVLEISTDDLPHIRGAQLRIALGRSGVRAENPNVVWLSLEPFEITTVTWGDTFGLYASITEPWPGATVTVVGRRADVVPYGYYTFTSSAVFEGPFSDNVAPNEYSVLNNMPHSCYPSMLFGLEQSSTVQGNPEAAKVASVKSVLATRRENYPPLPFAFIWLESGVVSGNYIQNNFNNLAVANFSSDGQLRFIYDPNEGMFVPNPLPFNHDTRFGGKTR